MTVLEMNAGVDNSSLAFAPDEIELFLHHEARLLDKRRFREWMELFTDDGVYWVPAVPGQESPLNHVSLFFDDSTHMKTRVARLEHPMIHVQTPPSRTVHQLGRAMLEQAGDDGGEIMVSSSVIMIEYRMDNQRLFAGHQYHRLRRDGSGFRIAHKRVDLVNCDGPFGPMAVPI